VDSSPVWSPDGKQIAFAEVGPFQETTVYVVDVDGRRKRRLSQKHRFGLNVNAYAPRWSPDSRTVAFAGGQGVFLVSRNGTNLRTVKRTKVIYGARAVTWSPDGEQLVFFATDTPRSTGRPTTTLYLLNLRDRSLRVRYEKKSPFLDDLSWSPDGRTLVWHEGLCEIAFAAVKGISYRYLTRPDGLCMDFPTWSPDSSHIAVTTWTRIAVRHLYGRGLRFLTPTPRTRTVSVGPVAWSARRSP
jgi:Tol biopolymer transport system component